MATTDAVHVQLYGDYATLVATDGAIALWRFNEISGAAAADAIGATPGVIVGGVTLAVATGQPDGTTAFTFNGSSGKVTVADAAALHRGDVFSVEVWVKRSSISLGARAALFDGNTGSVTVSIDTDNKIRVDKNGTAQIVKSSVTIADTTTWHHVLVTKTGATTKIYLDGVDVTGAVSNQTIGNTNGLFIGALTGGSLWFPGTLDEVAYYPTALSAAQALAHWRCGQWTDLTSDLVDADIVVSRGFQSNAPGDNVAAPPMMVFGLNNKENAGNLVGYYSLDSANLRAGWAIGNRVRRQVTTNATTRTRFFGWLEDVDPTTGLYEDLTVKCTAVGWLGHAATTLVSGISAQISKRADELLATLIPIVPFPPLAQSLGTGLDTFPRAFHDVDPESGTVLDAADSVIKSGFADRLYEKADGTLVYEPRSFRQTAAANALVLTDAAPDTSHPSLGLTRLPAARRRSTIKNRFQVTVHPTRVDMSAVVLYALQLTGSTQTIGPNTTVTLEGAFVDPNQVAQQVGGYNMLVSDGAGGSMVGASGTLPNADFDFGTAAGLTDLSASMLVSVVYEFAKPVFTITNPTLQTAYYTKLQCRGQGIYDYQIARATSSDLVSQRTAGQMTVTFDCPYQADPAFADAAVQFALNLYAPSMTQLDEGVQVEVFADDELSMDVMLQLEVSTAIGISESVSGLAVGNYWVNAITETFDERRNATFVLKLTPRDANTYFTVDVSTIDGPDVVAAI